MKLAVLGAVHLKAPVKMLKCFEPFLPHLRTFLDKVETKKHRAYYL